MPSLADLRTEYRRASLDEREVSPRSVRPVRALVRRGPRGRASGGERDDARHGRRRRADPAARIVLLKAFDERGFVFYTNYAERKGRGARREPARRAPLLLGGARAPGAHRGHGRARRRADADAYFASRPRESPHRRRGIAADRDDRRAAPGSRRASPTLDVDASRRVDPAAAALGRLSHRPGPVRVLAGPASRLHDRIAYAQTARSGGSPGSRRDVRAWSLSPHARRADRARHRATTWCCPGRASQCRWTRCRGARRRRSSAADRAVRVAADVLRHRRRAPRGPHRRAQADARGARSAARSAAALPAILPGLPALFVAASLIGLSFMLFQVPAQHATGELGAPADRARELQPAGARLRVVRVLRAADRGLRDRPVSAIAGRSRCSPPFRSCRPSCSPATGRSSRCRIRACAGEARRSRARSAAPSRRCGGCSSSTRCSRWAGTCTRSSCRSTAARSGCRPRRSG